MGTITRRTFDSPDERLEFTEGTGRAAMLKTESGMVARSVFEPGWSWSENARPLAGTDSCQSPHKGYIISGRMLVRSDEGDEVTFTAGDLMDIKPGHDAKVVGNEACVVIDWAISPTYAETARR